jgi:hypothetical protein
VPTISINLVFFPRRRRAIRSEWAAKRLETMTNVLKTQKTKTKVGFTIHMWNAFANKKRSPEASNAALHTSKISTRSVVNLFEA